MRRRDGPSGCLPALVVVPLRAARRVTGRAPTRHEIGRGLALRGRIWDGIADLAFNGVVVAGVDGRVAAVGPGDAVALPDGLQVIDCVWIGPGVTDAHVHLATTATSGHDEMRAGLVAVRDLGSPVERLAHWRMAAPIVVAGAGPRVTGAVDPRPDLCTDRAGREVFAREPVGRGLGVRSWTYRSSLRRGTASRTASGIYAPGRNAAGRNTQDWDALDGEAVAVVDSPAAARRLVASLVADGVDLIKVCVEGVDGTEGGVSSGRAPLHQSDLGAVVDAAHAAGLAVTAHALTVRAVEMALRAGVDELAHVPLEPLPEEVVERIAAAGVAVVSTLQCHAGVGPAPARNAALLHRAGVPLIYGTDAGGASSRPPGVDPRELDRLAYAGLGRLGALRAATSGAARAAGFDGQRPSGRIEVGAFAALVGLPADPLVEPAAWRHPTVVVNGHRLIGA